MARLDSIEMSDGVGTIRYADDAGVRRVATLRYTARVTGHEQRGQTVHVTYEHAAHLTPHPAADGSAHLLDAAGADLLVTSVQAITINQARELLEHGRGEGGSPIRGAGRRLPDEVELVAWGVRLSREELIRRMPWRREG